MEVRDVLQISLIVVHNQNGLDNFVTQYSKTVFSTVAFNGGCASMSHKKEQQRQGEKAGVRKFNQVSQEEIPEWEFTRDKKKLHGQKNTLRAAQN